MGRGHRLFGPRRHLCWQPTTQGLRCSTGPLRRRQCVFCVWTGLPLLDVADEAADAPLLAPRLAPVFCALPRRAESLAPRRALCGEHRRATLHREAIAAA